MTKKDYVKIADALLSTRNELSNLTLSSSRRDAVHSLEIAASYLAEALLADNPRFNRAKFYQACGMTDNG